MGHSQSTANLPTSYSIRRRQQNEGVSQAYQPASSKFSDFGKRFLSELRLAGAQSLTKLNVDASRKHLQLNGHEAPNTEGQANPSHFGSGNTPSNNQRPIQNSFGKRDSFDHQQATAQPSNRLQKLSIAYGNQNVISVAQRFMNIAD